MKTLLLVRHAKSSWADSSLTDFERPLNERGKHDAPEMAKRIKAKKIDIDLFVSSPARRAKRTAELFLKELNARDKDLVLVKELYEAPADNFYAVIEALPDKKDTVALFAHNPGITDFINSLQLTHLMEMPTCGIYAITVDVDHWIDFKKSGKEFLFFDYPKS
ncbi:MAG TPA: histidine phosphatase family protein [Chitinophagaceae bacterium]|nr:histidine phosphatase family protein [Chitinophagaceae bacterium]